MMNNVLKWVIWISVIILVWLCIIKMISDNLGTVNPNIAVALIAGSFTIISYFITRYLDRKKNVEQLIREKKVPVYEEFINYVTKLLIDPKVDEIEMAEFLKNFNQKAVVWLTDESLKAYIEWVKYAREERPVSTDDNDYINNLILMENLLLQFRKDIGHNKKLLSKGDLLTIFINDLHKHDLRKYGNK